MRGIGMAVPIPLTKQLRICKLSDLLGICLHTSRSSWIAARGIQLLWQISPFLIGTTLRIARLGQRLEIYLYPMRPSGLAFLVGMGATPLKLAKYPRKTWCCDKRYMSLVRKISLSAYFDCSFTLNYPSKHFCVLLLITAYPC